MAQYFHKQTAVGNFNILAGRDVVIKQVTVVGRSSGRGKEKLMPQKTDRQEEPALASGGAIWPELEQKERRPLTKLDSEEIVDFCEDMGWDTYALRAFGVLLETADLGEFSDSQDSENLKVGLRKIVEMYVERQERKLNELRLKSIHSCDRVISRARQTYEMTKSGACVSLDVALEDIRRDLNRLAMVIAEYGDEYPQALAIREKLMNLQKAIQAKKMVASTKKA